MSKSKEELNKLKEEVEAVNEKLAELTEEEIAQVNGGVCTSLTCAKRDVEDPKGHTYRGYMESKGHVDVRVSSEKKKECQ